MLLDLKLLLKLVRDSVSDPRRVARILLQMGLPDQAKALAFALVLVLGVILAQLALLLLPLSTGGQIGGAVVAPIAMAIMQAAIMLGLAVGMSRGAQLFGGRGRFADALLLVTFCEFALMVLQLVQLVATLLFPFASMAIGIAGVVLFFWLLTHFTAELNGFASAPKVFMGLIAGFFLAALVMAMVLTSLGVSPQILAM